MMVFNDKGILQHVNFELPLNKFESILNTLKKDYKLVTSRTNDGLYAQLENKDSLVELTNLDIEGMPGEFLMVDYYTKEYKQAMDAEYQAQYGGE